MGATPHETGFEAGVCSLDSFKEQKEGQHGWRGISEGKAVGDETERPLGNGGVLGSPITWGLINHDKDQVLL